MRILMVIGASVLLAACNSAPSTGLAPGLTAAMDQPGAQLDRSAALGLINQFRATRGAPGLAGDPSLDAQAEALARQYAETGAAPAKPLGSATIQVSAGYTRFADTFSGWRNSGDGANALAMPTAQRAGLAVVNAPNSAYGTYWVLLLG